MAKRTASLLIILLLVTIFQVNIKADEINYGYIPSGVDTSAFYVEEKNYPGLYNASSFPSSYSLKNYDTEVKSQGCYGTCWAHSVMASAEITYMKEYGRKLDLSELKLAYYCYNTEGISDKLNLISNDYSFSTMHLYNNVFTNGGNPYSAAKMLATGIGFDVEENMPYTMLPESSRLFNRESFEKRLNHDNLYNNPYYLKNAFYLSALDSNTIKKVLMEYGGITASYYSNDYSYLNYDTNAYYCPASATNNHAITIIGWDDSYSKDNFKVTPKGDGAWLVKNSWGPSWGDNGYFWLSYYDNSFAVSDGVACFEIDDQREDMRIYQYDGTFANSFNEAPGKEHSEGNVYTAQRNEYIQRVGFYTAKPDVSYTILIYKNVSGDPDDGSLVYSSSGNSAYAGYHTVDLNEKIRLNKGDRFSIVMNFTGADCFEVEMSETYSWNQSITYEEKNQSYFRYANGFWIDGAEYGMTCRLKVHTYADGQSNPSYKISYKNVDSTKGLITSYESGRETYLINPDKTGYIFNGWYLDADLTNRVSVISSQEKGDLTLYAKWSPKEYSITFNLNGGSLNKANPVSYTIESETFHLNEPYKEGYTFTGYYDTDNNRVDYIYKGTVGNLVLTAKYSLNSHTVTVNKGKGIDTVTYDGRYNYNDRINLNIALLDGYENLNLSGDFTSTSFIMPDKDVLINAAATPIEYSITFNLNGGSLNKANPVSYTIESETFHLNEPYKEGYTFTGYYDTDNNKVDYIYKGTVGNLVLTAKYEEEPVKVDPSINVPAITLKNGVSGITVSWTKTADESYELYRAEEGKEEYTLIAETDNDSYYDQSTKNGTLYTYCLRVIKDSKTVSDFGNIQTIKRLTRSSVTLKNSISGITVSFKEVDGADGYLIYRSTDNKNFTKVASVKTLSYYDKDAKSSDTTYFYKVIAYSKYNGVTSKSSASKVVSLLRLSRTSITSLTENSKGIRIFYKEVKGATNYYIYRSTDNINFSKIKTTSALAYTDKKAATKNQTYYYKVIAFNDKNSIITKAIASKSSSIVKS